MSYEAIDAVIARSKSSGGARALLLVLAHHANREGRDAYPSVATLAAEANMDRRQVQRALRKLADAGEIAIEEATGRGRTSSYSILLLDPPIDKRAVNTPPFADKRAVSAPPFSEERAVPIPPFSEKKGDILSRERAVNTPPKHIVNLRDDEEEENARARDAKLRPIPKERSARKPDRRRSSSPASSVSSSVAPSSPSIETLLRDPLLLQLSQTFVDLAGKPLEYLADAEIEEIARKRAEYGERLTPAMIDETKRIAAGRGAQSPVAFWWKVLAERVAGRTPPKPNGSANGNGNGNGYRNGASGARSAPAPAATVPPASLRSVDEYRPPPRAVCALDGCTDPVAAPVGAKYCIRHGLQPYCRELKEELRLRALAKTKDTSRKGVG